MILQAIQDVYSLCKFSREEDRKQQQQQCF